MIKYPIGNSVLVTHCVYSELGGEVLVEVPKGEHPSSPEFLGSKSVLIGDIDIISGQKNSGHCLPSRKYGKKVLKLAMSHWDDLSWVVYETPGGFRFFVDTLNSPQGTNDLILQSTCSDPLYRLISKRRGYYSARLQPKEDWDKGVTLWKARFSENPSEVFVKLWELHRYYAG
jgi:hypothetical protein